MPVDQGELVKEIKAGFTALNLTLAALTTATSGNKVDLTGVEAGLVEIAEKLELANTQMVDVIGTYSDGKRVKVFNETPAP